MSGVFLSVHTFLVCVDLLLNYYYFLKLSVNVLARAAVSAIRGKVKMTGRDSNGRHFLVSKQYILSM